MRKNTASQVVSFQAISATDGSSVTSGTPTVYYTIDGGTQGTGTATPVHEGQGQWSWVPTQAETNGNHLAYTFVLSGCISQTINIYTISFDPHDTVRLGITALPNAAADAAGGLVISDSGGLAIDTVASNVAAILVDTGTDIPNALVTIDTVVDAILVDTGTDIPTLINTVDSVVDAILVDTAEIGAAGAGLTNLPWNAAWDAEVESEVNDGLVAIHLDHLLATDYDPASKPGTATALLNELIESNGGVSRYTAAALAQAPSGTGGDATAANQTTILNHLTDIKGGTFSGATDSLEAIRDRGDSAWTTGAGGSDRLLMVDTTIATLGSQANFTLTSGSADDDAYNGCTIVIEDASTATQKAVGVVFDYVGSSRTVTLIADPAVFTMAASDKVYILAERSVKSSSASSFFINAGDVASEASVQSVDTAVGNILSALPTNFTDMAISAGTGYVIASSVQGNVTGSVASVSGAVGSVTGAVGSVTGNVGGNVTGSVGSVLGGINTSGGTITTLDALDTAQDSQHATTQGLVTTVDTVVDSILVDTNELQTDWANGGRLDLLLDGVATPAQVNAQVVDALATDTYAEPGQGTPAATASLAAKINYLYKAWRNKKTQTATTLSVFADDGTIVDQKSTVSDDGTTATVGEIASGP